MLGAIKSYLCVLAVACCMLLPVHAHAVDEIGFDGLMKLLASQRGRVVVVNFWATWCGPCLKELPGLMNIREDFTEDELYLVGISLDFESTSVDNFLKRKPFNYPVYQAEQDLMSLLKIHSIPKMLVYDAEGLEVLNHEGYMEEMGLRVTINKLLSGGM